MENSMAAILVLALYVPFLGLCIYICVLFIKVTRRGIKALDIYLDKNKNDIIN